MKKPIIGLLLSLLVTPSVFARECATTPLSASYTHLTYDGQHTQTQLIKLFRDNNQVAIEQQLNPAIGPITEFWHKLPNQRFHVIRYFNKHKRGIEYQADEIGNNDWSQIQQLISNEKIDSTPLIATIGEGCDLLEIRQQQTGLIQITLEWLPKQQLIKRMTVYSRNNLQTLTLEDKITANTAVRQQFALLDSYETTDYSDIGDNESDAFLSSMINQGFISHGASGFYSSEGHKIDGDHKH